MSVESISKVLAHSKAEKTDRLVLLVIANHDGDGGSWPSVATLARGANTSERSVQRAIKSLVELGEIVVHRNDGGTHKTRADRRPNRYEITIDTAPDETQSDTPNGVTPLSPRQPERGDTTVTPPTPHGVTPTASRGDTAVSPEPSLTKNNPPTPTGKPAGESQHSCPAHPTGRPNCRRCGTTPRQLAAADKTRNAQARRDAQIAAQIREREAAQARRAKHDPTTAAAAIAATKAAVARTRQALKEQQA